MRFEVFKIGEYQLHSVDRVEVSKAARKRVVQTNLNGDMLIDQSAVKRTVTAHLILASAADVAAVDVAVQAAIVTISFYEGAEQVTIEATISNSVRPKPFYYNGDRAQGVYYNGITLVFEER